MGGGEDFLLKWNDHHSLFFTGAEELLEKEEYTDVTLAAGNRFFSAHRLVLSICSPFFQSLFKRLGNQKTVIFMKDIEPQHLELLLEYMYKGEIKVQESELVNVLSAAQSLEVKGLTDSGGGGGGGNTKSTSNKSSNLKQDPVPSHTSSSTTAGTNTTVGGTKRPSPGPVGGGGVSTDSPARKRANLSTKENNLSSISNATATSQQQHSSSAATTAVVKQEHQQHHDVVTITDPRPPVIADVRRHHHHQSWAEEGDEGEDYEEGGEGEDGVYGEGGEGVEEGEVTALGGEHMEGGQFDQSGEGYGVEELGGYDEGEYYEGGGGVAGEGAAAGGGGINISQEEDRAADMMGDGRLLSVRFPSSRFAICKYCNKDFKTPSLLERHITVHTKEKKFVCVCGRGYTRSDRLRKHMDTCRAVGGCAAKENVVVADEKNAAKMRKMNKKAGKGVEKTGGGRRLHSLEDFFDENVHEEDEGDEEPYIVHPFIVSE